MLFPSKHVKTRFHTKGWKFINEMFELLKLRILKNTTNENIFNFKKIVRLNFRNL